MPENEFTYDDTRLFTSFIADYLISKDPDSFTIERMKKKRGNRLYVDYVQHSEGKTIVAPYSMRGNEHAGVATPLYWEEVTEKLDLISFTMENAFKRIQKQGDPFSKLLSNKINSAICTCLRNIKKRHNQKRIGLKPYPLISVLKYLCASACNFS